MYQVNYFFPDLTGSEFNLYMPGMDQTKSGNRSVQGSSSTENKTGTTLQSSSQGNSLGNSQHISDNQPAFFRFGNMLFFLVISN